MGKSITLNATPTWPGVPNDFTLWFEAHSIGRIRRDQAGWHWQLTIPMAMPAWTSGITSTFEAAQQSFGVAWGKLLNETSPERLERAWEFERAVEARRQRMEAARKDQSKGAASQGDETATAHS